VKPRECCRALPKQTAHQLRAQDPGTTNSAFG
jgi:hypothetical protein